MKAGMVGIVLVLVFLTGCQNAKVNPLSNVAAPAAAMTAESCKATMETYMKAIEANPDKYTEENLSAYPEMMQYGMELGKCQEKGFLTPQEMMKVAEKVDAEAAAHSEEAETADAETQTDTE